MDKRRILNIVLVGSNPLPCYIQTLYMLEGKSEKLGTPAYTVFIATDGESDKFVENIKFVLEKKEISFESDTIKIKNGYDSQEIEQTVKTEIAKIVSGRKIDKILLNNTGGTKSMAIYATLAVRQLNLDMTECFVDPRTNRLRCYTVDKCGGKGTPTLDPPQEKKSLKDLVQLTIDELVHLHYGKNVTMPFSDKNGKNKKEKPFKGLTEEQWTLANELLTNEELFEKYCKLQREHYIPLRSRGINKPNQRVATLIQENHGAEVQEIFDVCGKKLDFNKDRCYIAIFMEGDWLEQYFYKALLDAKARLDKAGKYIETALSYKVNPENGKGIELDILALKGYELTLFSVSMADNDSEAKGKWFEAVYRTEQIAGEHGKVSLVNFLVEGKKLEMFKEDLKTFQREVDDYNRTDMGNYQNLVQMLVDKFS